jgi:hypothetical protein
MKRIVLPLSFYLALVTSITCAATLLEDFNDGITPSWWTVETGYPYDIGAPDSEGRLRITKTADYQTYYSRITSTFTLEGNMSAYVDFNLLTFPTYNSGIDGNVLQLAVITTSGYAFGTSRYTTEGGHYVTGYTKQFGFTGTNATNASTGTLGITRTGNTISAWADYGSGLTLLGGSLPVLSLDTLRQTNARFLARSVLQ